MSDLVWLIPMLPLVGSITLLLFGRRIGEPRSGWLATATVLTSFAATLGIYIDLLSRDEHHRRITSSLFTWVPACLLYTSPSPRDRSLSRMPSSA